MDLCKDCTGGHDARLQSNPTDVVSSQHETYGLGPERALIVKPIPGARLTWLRSMLGHQENATLRLAVAG